MGLTGTTTWVRNSGRNDTANVQSYNTAGTPLDQIWINGQNWFVLRLYGEYGFEYKFDRCIFVIKTDAAGCANLSFTCGGYKSSDGHAAWKVTANRTLDTSGMTECSYSGGTWSGTLNNVKLMPNTTYYVLFDTWTSGTAEASMRGTMTITGSGTYGAPGNITANNTNFDSPINMSYASATSGASYTVKVKLGNSAEVTLQTKSSTSSRSWTPSLATYGSSYPNQASVSCVITVETYFGNTLSGTKTKTVTVSFTAAQAGPSTSNAFSIAPYNAGAVAGMNGYIQGYSKIRASFNSSNVTKRYGASVAKWTVKFGSAAAVDVAAGTATKDSGNISAVTTVVCTVVDSRGFTASETYTTTIIPYENPALTATVKRTDAAGNEDSDGTYIRIDLAGWYSNIEGQNTQVSVVRKKLASASSYGTDVTITGGTTTLNGTRKLYSVANFLVSGMTDAVYNVQVEITDALGNKAVVDVVVESQHWAIHFRNKGSGAALGRAAEFDGVLDVGTWDIYLRDSNGNIVSLKSRLGI